MFITCNAPVLKLSGTLNWRFFARFVKTGWRLLFFISNYSTRVIIDFNYFHFVVFSRVIRHHILKLRRLTSRNPGPIMSCDVRFFLIKNHVDIVLHENTVYAQITQSEPKSILSNGDDRITDGFSKLITPYYLG